MRTRLAWSLAAFLVSALSSPASAAAQHGCNEPFTNGWLMRSRAETPVSYDSPQVFPVTRHLLTAIALLDSASIVSLAPDEVQRFTDQIIVQPGLRPYLVRAVFPTANPRIGIGQRGDNLTVFAGGLGCAPYSKHPLVIFLARKPKRVYVDAAAAL